MGRRRRFAVGADRRPERVYGRGQHSRLFGGYDLAGAAIAQAVSGEAALNGAKPVVSTENGYATGTIGQGIPDASCSTMLSVCSLSNAPTT